MSHHPIRVDPHTTRLSTPPIAAAGRTTRSRNSLAASVSPPPTSSRTRTKSPATTLRRRESSSSVASKENTKPVMPIDGGDLVKEDLQDGTSLKSNAGKGKSKMTSEEMTNGSTSRDLRDSSLEPIEDAQGGIIRKRNPPRNSTVSPRAKSPGLNPKPYNGIPTLPTIPDPGNDQTNNEDDIAVDGIEFTFSKPPPPAPSAGVAIDPTRLAPRRRRSSSIKRKLSPGVVPTKVVDWEIPRKALHSSIGFLTLLLNHLNPPTLKPLLTVLTTGLIACATADLLRLRFQPFAEIWELYFGFLMRESERNKINGVIWYLVGVIFVLACYPRDVAVVSILTLSWSDTTASTIGRLWGRYTKPLPAHFPGIKYLPFAPRKSLAGFLAATFTGLLICLGFWWTGSSGKWNILDGEHWGGLLLTSWVVGVGGAVVEALDLGLDDNLTLPILSGAIIWGWLGITNLIV